MKIFYTVVLLSLFGFSSCATRGKDFSPNVEWIKLNQTKQADVAKYLGEPMQMGSASGVPTWTYGFYKFSLFNEFRSRELKIWWNADRSVKDYSFNSSFPEDKARLQGYVP